MISENRENTYIEKGQRSTCLFHLSHIFPLLPADPRPFLLCDHFLLFFTRLQQYTMKCHFRAIALSMLKDALGAF